MSTTPLDWRRTYPCLAAVMAASLDTLATWREHLPAPQTDVERTVSRRLNRRFDEVAKSELRRQAPELAAKYEDVIARLARLGIKVPS